jgi:superkiller protein 3
MRWLLVAFLTVAAVAQENPVEQAIAAMQRNDFAAAAPLLQAGADAEPGNASIQFNLGFALSQLGRDEAAVAAYLKALEINPELHQAFSNVGVLLVRVDRAPEAVSYLAKAIERRPDDPQILYFYAHALAASGKLEAAIPIYEGAGELDPDEPSIWVELGQAQAQLDQIDEATVSFQKAAAIDPELRSYQLQLAERVEQNGGHDQALGLYRSYLADDPSHVAVRERVGMLLLEMEDYTEAARELEKVVEQSPTDAARMALARAYSAADDVEMARTKWGEAVAANPNEAELRVRYAGSLVKAFEYETAGEQYIAAVKLDDQNPTAWAGLAFALHQAKNYEASLQALINANGLKPLNPASLYLRAITEDRLQLHLEAKASYESFLASGSGMEDEEWKSQQRLRAIERVLERR